MQLHGTHLFKTTHLQPLQLQCLEMGLSGRACTDDTTLLNVPTASVTAVSRASSNGGKMTLAAASPGTDKHYLHNVFMV